MRIGVKRSLVRKMTHINLSEYAVVDEPQTGQDQKPLTLRETLSVVIAGHLGVRKREQRREDFHRANGLHIFIAAAIYFIVIVTSIVFLVRYITA